ncbi:MAG TPA: glycoside hydrolase family 2 TIM barrel-domain containing protein [Armatimonadota bacterium]|nr:glycoside hydrolase family 2 TIM barrel-domain containing protein [Armatimonadota bacterium]
MDKSQPFSRRDAVKVLAALATVPTATLASPSVAKTAAEAAVHDTRDRLLDGGWRFHRGDAPGAELPAFDDAEWRRVSVPHDWSIEDLPPQHAESTGEGALWDDATHPPRVGPFDRDRSEGKGSTGWVVGGTGWYRKRFAAPADRQVEVRFDGVYMNSDVWLNGEHLGHHPYGYTGFAYDLTPHLHPEGENVLAVRVRNEGRNSRWYSGSGIYRHVWLTVTGDVRVPLWSVSVTTPEVAPEAATVKVAVRVENRGRKARDVKVRVRLFDADDASAGMGEVVHSVPAGGEVQVEQVLVLAAPKLWSPEAPHLYRAEVDLLVGGKRVDRVSTTPFGIRRIEVDAARGLRLNGTALKLKGGCLHHDNGVLGAAAIDRAEERRVELMKANGFNAIRCSHNPPSSVFLDACDRLGMLVIDEAFDQWERSKNPQDYHLYFREWGQRDLESMVRRDRNHPSVIFWSIGNEIPERADPGGIETAKRLVETVKRLDATRPVTAGIPTFFEGGRQRPWTDSDLAFQHLDVAGYNYLWQQYEPDHQRHPRRVILGTESFAQHAFENWQLVEKHPYVIGDFVWTGMDHLGESGIGNAQLSTPTRGPAGPPAAGNVPVQGNADAEWAASFSLALRPYPWFNAYCGDLDLIGEKKPQSYYRDVVWGRSPLEMAVQRPVPQGRRELLSPWGWSDELRSWTWPGQEGKPLQVRIYTRGDQVRLLLNGKEIGIRPVSAATKLRAEFTVPYAPGELRAVALAQGRPIAELAFKTVGPPAQLRLKVDRQAIRRDRRDLAFVTVEVLDREGHVVPDAVVPVAFRIRGAGELAGAGSANPRDARSFQQPRARTFHGKCLAVLRPTGSAGAISLRAEAEGLAAAETTIRVY